MLSLARLLVCPTSLTIVVGLHLSGFGLAWRKSILMRVQNPKQYTFYRLFVCFSGVPFSLKLSCRVPLTKKFGKRCINGLMGTFKEKLLNLSQTPKQKKL